MASDRLLQNFSLKQGINALDRLGDDLTNAQKGLKNQMLLAKMGFTNFQAAAPGIAEITAGIDTVIKVVDTYDKYFNKFFDTTEIKEASAYLQKNKESLMKVAYDESVNAINGMAQSLNVLVDVKTQTGNMMSIVIDGTDNVSEIYDDIEAAQGLTPDQKRTAFLASVDLLVGTLDRALALVQTSRGRLVKTSSQ